MNIDKSHICPSCKWHGDCDEESRNIHIPQCAEYDAPNKDSRAETAEIMQELQKHMEEQSCLSASPYDVLTDTISCLAYFKNRLEATEPYAKKTIRSIDCVTAYLRSVENGDC